MRNKKIILLLFAIFFVASIQSQDTKNSWQVGAGVSLVMFGEEDSRFIGDTNLFQIPRLNATIPIWKNFSVDGAISFAIIDDIGLISNSVKYVSADAALRYNFNPIGEGIYPFVFVGGSVIDSERNLSPTFNFGAGGTYWLNEKWGINGQLMYKHSLETFQSMRSHLQGTIGVVYNFGGNAIFVGGRGSHRVKCF